MDEDLCLAAWKCASQALTVNHELKGFDDAEFDNVMDTKGGFCMNLFRDCIQNTVHHDMTCNVIACIERLERMNPEYELSKLIALVPDADERLKNVTWSDVIAYLETDFTTPRLCPKTIYEKWASKTEVVERVNKLNEYYQSSLKEECLKMLTNWLDESYDGFRAARKLAPEYDKLVDSVSDHAITTLERCIEDIRAKKALVQSPISKSVDYSALLASINACNNQFGNKYDSNVNKCTNSEFCTFWKSMSEFEELAHPYNDSNDPRKSFAVFKHYIAKDCAVSKEDLESMEESMDTKLNYYGPMMSKKRKAKK